MRELSNIQWLILAAFKLIKVVLLVFLFWLTIFVAVASVYVYF